jgi:hypothetical protein
LLWAEAMLSDDLHSFPLLPSEIISATDLLYSLHKLARLLGFGLGGLCFVAISI